jgi:hypothetical protein
LHGCAGSRKLGGAVEAWAPVLTAIVGAAAVLLGQWLTRRGIAWQAQTDRLWEARSALYLEILSWCDEQESAMDSEDFGEIPLPMNEEMTEDLHRRIIAFGSRAVRSCFVSATYAFQESEGEARLSLIRLKREIRKDLQGSEASSLQTWSRRVRSLGPSLRSRRHMRALERLRSKAAPLSLLTEPLAGLRAADFLTGLHQMEVSLRTHRLAEAMKRASDDKSMDVEALEEALAASSLIALWIDPDIDRGDPVEDDHEGMALEVVESIGRELDPEMVALALKVFEWVFDEVGGPKLDEWKKTPFWDGLVVAYQPYRDALSEVMRESQN